jgi:hypothetical protein
MLENLRAGPEAGAPEVLPVANRRYRSRAEQLQGIEIHPKPLEAENMNWRSWQLAVPLTTSI